MRGSATTKTRQVILDFDMFSEIITFEEKVDEDYIDNQIYDCYIVKREQIDLKNIKMQKSEVEQVKLCNLKEFNEIIENGNIMERDELYKKIIEYLK